MAAGDIYNQGITTITSGEFAMRPATGIEVVVHNISHSASATLQFTDGTDTIDVDTQTGAGSWMGMRLHCTNGKYYKVVSVGSVINKIAADGVYTK